MTPKIKITAKKNEGTAMGGLYNRFKDKFYDTAALEERILTLMADDDVTSKKGVYEYVQTGEECCVSVRPFSDTMTPSTYERQSEVCPKCERHLAIGQIKCDYITP